MPKLLDRYRQAPLLQRTLVSTAGSALLTLGFLGAIALGIDAATAGLRGNEPAADDTEETLAAGVGASESEGDAGPVSRGQTSRRPGAASKVRAQSARTDEGRRGGAEPGRGDE
jgi:hypothetical protein